MDWLKKDKAYIWHPFTQHQTEPPHIIIEKGEGAYIFDTDGNKYIDAVSSWWTNVHGHAHPYINQKLAEQAAQMEHVIFAGFSHPQAIRLAERILKRLPDNIDKVFFSDNGSTANEVALKMAIQYFFNKGEKRKTIIAFDDAYHGDTFGAMSMSGRSIFTAPFDDYMFDIQHFPIPTDENREQLFEDFEKLCATNVVAAFIFEPLVQGAGGMKMYAAEDLDQLIGIAKKYQTLCIADEVMTGFGRTNTFFATDQTKNKPDIYCLSKGLTGGYMPLSLTCCSDEIYNAFLSNDKLKTLFHGHSYTGNPLACAVANASLDIFDQQETTYKRKNIIQQHQDFSNQIKDHPSIQNLRQQGTIIAMDIVSDTATSYTNPIRDRMYQYFLKEGILLRPLGNTLYILPPYCITKDQLNKVYSAIKSWLKKV